MKIKKQKKEFKFFFLCFAKKIKSPPPQQPTIFIFLREMSKILKLAYDVLCRKEFDSGYYSGLYTSLTREFPSCMATGDWKNGFIDDNIYDTRILLVIAHDIAEREHVQPPTHAPWHCQTTSLRAKVLAEFCRRHKHDTTINADSDLYFFVGYMYSKILIDFDTDSEKDTLDSRITDELFNEIEVFLLQTRNWNKFTESRLESDWRKRMFSNGEAILCATRLGIPYLKYTPKNLEYHITCGIHPYVEKTSITPNTDKQKDLFRSFQFDRVNTLWFDNDAQKRASLHNTLFGFPQSDKDLDELKADYKSLWDRMWSIVGKDNIKKVSHRDLLRLIFENHSAKGIARTMHIVSMYTRLCRNYIHILQKLVPSSSAKSEKENEEGTPHSKLVDMTESIPPQHDEKPSSSSSKGDVEETPSKLIDVTTTTSMPAMLFLNGQTYILASTQTDEERKTERPSYIKFVGESFKEF